VRFIQFQDYLIHLDQVVRVKTPAVDDVAIGRDEIRRDQTPAIRHDRAARFQKRDEIAGFFADDRAGSVANESAVTTGTDHNLAVIAHAAAVPQRNATAIANLVRAQFTVLPRFVVIGWLSSEAKRLGVSYALEYLAKSELVNIPSTGSLGLPPFVTKTTLHFLTFSIASLASARVALSLT
jgi:hypothetical protein